VGVAPLARGNIRVEAQGRFLFSDVLLRGSLFILSCSSDRSGVSSFWMGWRGRRTKIGFSWFDTECF